MNTRPIRNAVMAVLMLALLAFAACEMGDEPAALDEPGVQPAQRVTEAPEPQIEPVSVVASIYPLGFFAERVAGDLATVEVLVDVGVENHGFTPTASDLQSIDAADVVVMNGLELEPWLERALDALGPDPDRFVVEAADEARAIEGSAHGHGEDEAEGHEEDEDHGHEEDDEHAHEDDEESEHDDDDGHEEDEDHGHEEDDEHAHEDDEEAGHDEDDGHEEEEGHEEDEDHGHEEDDEHAHGDDGDNGHEEGELAHDHGELDPHVWLDPVLAVVQVERIRDALIGIDPDNAAVYRANAAALIGELESLDAEFDEGLDTCRHDHFVTSHDAYGYLAERYGLEQIPVTGLSPEAEPSPLQLAAISDQVAELGLRYVMVEPVLAGGLTETIARENNVDLISIHAIASVTQSELDAHGDYMGLMRDNLANLKVALDCA